MKRSPQETIATLPSDAELRILRQLWIHGEQSVGDLRSRVSGEWDIGYTTVLKLLQRMLKKGLVVRREDGRAHQYRPTVTAEQTERRLAKDILARTFGGSLKHLVLAALPTAAASEAELREIRRLLDRKGT